MSNKPSKKINKIIFALLAFVIGASGGFLGLTYLTMPNTEQLIKSDDIYYSKDDSSSTTQGGEVQSASGAVSVHFLELGNKYTGDCTYIKVGENIDILIDCGSKSNSILAVDNYLKRYVTDGKLEYVIVTHAHQDHYAGFATNTKTDSIFDLYECQTIIDFGDATNQTNGTTYNNYLRERSESISKGANYYSVLDCWNQTNGGKRVFELESDIKLEILYNYYYENKASTENNYSVCCQIVQGEKKFLFTGDLEAEGEEKLVQNNSLSQVEVYKAGHHGSKTSSTERLLQVIRPKIVCVCCCAGSSEYTSNTENQFPTKEFIERIAPYTTKVYVTSLCINYKNNEFGSFNGDIVVISKETNQVVVDCSNNNTLLKDSDWFKQNRLEMCRANLPNSWLG